MKSKNQNLIYIYEILIEFDDKREREKRPFLNKLYRKKNDEIIYYSNTNTNIHREKN